MTRPTSPPRPRESASNAQLCLPDRGSPTPTIPVGRGLRDAKRGPVSDGKDGEGGCSMSSIAARLGPVEGENSTQAFQGPLLHQLQ